MDFRIPLHLLGSQTEVELGGPGAQEWHTGVVSLSETRKLFSLYLCFHWLASVWVSCITTGQLTDDMSPLRPGILLALFRDILCYVTGMAFSVLAYRAVSPKHCFYSSFRRFSILFSRVLNYLVLSPVQDIAYQGLPKFSSTTPIIDLSQI